MGAESGDGEENTLELTVADRTVQCNQVNYRQYELQLNKAVTTNTQMHQSTKVQLQLQREDSQFSKSLQPTFNYFEVNQ